MAKKDPAALLYIDTWKVATTEMSAIERAYYMDLILHQYDKGSLPNDIEELANICRVRFSEFEQFKQVFEQVLKQKFEENENGRLENEFASEIIRKRQKFVEKRSSAGKLSYVLKYFRKNFKLNKGLEQFIKDNIDLGFDIKDEQMLKQVFEQISELYINGNKDEIEDINKREINFKEKVFLFSDYSEDMLTDFFNYWSQHGENDKKMLFEKQRSFEIKKRLQTWKKNESKFKGEKGGFQNNQTGNAASKKTILPSGNIQTEWSK